MEHEHILQEIARHYARYPRPDNYIDRDHCCECAEYYAELLDVPVGALAKEHVGDGAWDPTCFLVPDGFRYYLPAMLRIADGDRDWLDLLAPRFTAWYTDTLTGEDVDVIRPLLEEWWADSETSESARSALEAALSFWIRCSR